MMTWITAPALGLHLSRLSPQQPAAAKPPQMQKAKGQAH
jgi:hypothetical protein